MAHHQHHGADYEDQMSRSLSTRPTSSHATSMPAISEDELLADPDEPPDPHAQPPFTKHTYPTFARRQSLLTKALHTDSESHDEDGYSSGFFRNNQSVSSTSSNPSVRSTGDFTSDDGHVSPSTRPSTPGSPHSILSIPKLQLPTKDLALASSSVQDATDDIKAPQEPSKEAHVEAVLGRKRCVMFQCADKNKDTALLKDAPKVTVQEAQQPAVPKRPCTIKFACPFKANKAKQDYEASGAVSRHLSPAPPTKGSPAFHRRHRDSDTTIRNESPTTPKASSSATLPSPNRTRKWSQQSDFSRADACKFHEFASEPDDADDWVEESTCHKTRLTVDDTLQKEKRFRDIADEIDEEEALAEEIESVADDEDDEDDDDLFSDEGWKTDNEEGFADSDEDDSDSDYEWWAPRKTRAASPYVGHDVFRPVATGTMTDSSIDSDEVSRSPGHRGRRGRHSNKRTLPLKIRPGTPELPDSTDFVCGTLDEDRPVEDAYVSCLEQRKAAKHRVVPQDIDPSFPLSDPEIGSDDDADLDAADAAEESEHFMHGRFESHNEEDEEPRGRQRIGSVVRLSPDPSPKRLRSPPPPSILKKSCAQHRSPAPVSIFNRSSPRRMRSPPPPTRMSSPPPSRRDSTTASPSYGIGMNIAFQSLRGRELTHTSSLPRSPGPMSRHRPSRSPPAAIGQDDDDDEGSATDRPNDTHRYTRGAIDISQGLERKRLKRREKFYQKYARKEEKKERMGKRPCPGKGAQRMRQIGLECAIYRGKRMLSI